MASAIVLYPNPASTQVRLIHQAVAREEANSFITDISGRMSKKYALQARKNEIELNTEQLSRGIYFLKVGSANGEVVKKLMIVK